MDPFLEGQHVWRDFHTRFVTELSDRLVPQVRPRYVVLLEEDVYVEFAPPAATQAEARRETRRYVDIRHRREDRLVTAIELLSPTNKRSGSGGRSEYLDKRSSLLMSPVNVVEIDLLRGGERLPMADPLPACDFNVIVSRATERPTARMWAWSLHDPLPQIAIPLAGSDDDASIDLQAVFQAVYDHKGYDYILDYSAACVPPLDDGQAAWARGLLDRARSASDE